MIARFVDNENKTMVAALISTFMYFVVSSFVRFSGTDVGQHVDLGGCETSYKPRCSVCTDGQYFGGKSSQLFHIVLNTRIQVCILLQVFKHF